MKRILFLAAHRPGRSPGQRFRFEQYLPALEARGFTCDISYLLREHDDRHFYSKGRYFRKFLIFLRTLRIRLRDLRRAKGYDVIFLYREAVMFGSTWFERRLRRKGIPMVVDFDDAVWLPDVSEGNRRLAWMKRPSKISDIVALCDLVITGNEYLASYARNYNAHTLVIPTTINMAEYRPVSVKKERICIGWTGSITTLRHLESALPVLLKLQERFGDQLEFRVIADKEWKHSGLRTEFIRWRRETETEDLSAMDIGIMPLPDDEWTRGKCGFKGLQYMALGIPAVMSPVGVNTEIITDGQNGFLAANEEEWLDKLSRLIRDAALRKKLGDAGRSTVAGRYSFEAWRDRYVELFETLIRTDEKRRR